MLFVKYGKFAIDSKVLNGTISPANYELSFSTNSAAITWRSQRPKLPTFEANSNLVESNKSAMI